MQSIHSFLNHGRLPFAGRDHERKLLLDFWRSTPESEGLRVLLLQGEAGIGKSRLVDEVIDDVVAERGIPVRIRLYADTALSITPLIEESLKSTPEAAALLAARRQNGSRSLIADLRHLARLRPLLLVIEDLHTLEGEPVSELVRLLEGLADEPISLLCTIRPGDYPGADVLTRWPLERVELTGLDSAALEEIWNSLFDMPGDTTVVPPLMERTLGVPLALRNALAAALKGGDYAYDEEENEWRLQISPKTFDEKLQGDVYLLSRGMTAHITRGEREAGAILALLGEIMSEETARFLLGDRQDRLDILLYKQILIPVAPPRPLIGGKRRERYLGFAHSLIHRFLLEEESGTFDPAPLLEIVASSRTLASTLPLSILAERSDRLAPSDDTLQKAVDVLLQNGLNLENTPDWLLGERLIATAQRLVADHSADWSDEETIDYELRLRNTWLRLNRRLNHTPEYRQNVTAFVELTDHRTEKEWLPYRINALSYLYQQNRRVYQTGGFRKIWEEVHQLLEEHPSLQQTPSYIDFLEVVARVTNIPEDNDMADVVRARLTELLDDPEVPEEIRKRGMQNVMPMLLWRFHSAGELRERLETLARLEEELGPTMTLRTRKMALYDGIGRSAEALALANTLLPELREQGRPRDATQTRLFRLYAMNGFSVPTSAIMRELEEIVADAPKEITTALRRSIGLRLPPLLGMRGEYEAMTSVLEAYLGDQLSLVPENERLFIDQLLGRFPGTDPEQIELHRKSLQSDFQDTALTELIMTGEWSESGDDLVNLLTAALDQEYYMRSQILALHFYSLRLLQLLSSDLAMHVAPVMKGEIARGLDWLASNRLSAYISPLLDRYLEWATAGSDREKPDAHDRKVIDRWKRGLEEMISTEELSRTREEPEHPVEIGMFGDIRIGLDGDDPSRVRGGRLKILIGVMAAGDILPRRLTVEEFRSLVTEGEEDPEKSRKTTAMALLRLREAIGEENIEYRDDLPYFNRSSVHIDIVDAFHHFRSALQEARQGLLVRAWSGLLSGLELWRGETPFPALYDNFFEALRSDFEALARQALLETVGRGMEEGDLESAMEVLKKGREVMPGDEEVTELYCAILERRGERVEAERLRAEIEV